MVVYSISFNNFQLLFLYRIINKAHTEQTSVLSYYSLLFFSFHWIVKLRAHSVCEMICCIPGLRPFSSVIHGIHLDNIKLSVNIPLDLIKFKYIWKHVLSVVPFLSRFIWSDNWTASSEFGPYSICEQRRFRRACASAHSPEPPLLAHTSSESSGTFRQKARSLASLNGWACTVKICHDGNLEDTNSLDGAHMLMHLQPQLHICFGKIQYTKEVKVCHKS